MSLKVGDAAEKVMLQDILTAHLSGAKLKLYKNNRTPVDADVLADYTEANFSGYAAITLNSWGTIFTNGSNKAEVDEILRTFTCTGASPSNDIYGYYVTDSAGTTLLYAELASGGPYTINANGQTYSVQPKFTLNSE